MDRCYVKVKSEGREAALITLSRPEKRNALNIALMEELCAALDALAREGCRVVVMTSEGSAFCAGLDLHEAAEPALMESSAVHVAKTLSTLYSTPLVTIAAVQGDAFGGGAGLAVACDLIVMASGARIGFPEVRRGLVAAQVSTVLMRQASPRVVRELLLTGEAVTADRALQMGLVNRVVASGALMEEAMRYAEQVLQGALGAVKLTKKMISDYVPKDFAADLQHGLALHHAVRQSEEAKEGIQAFLEKK